MAVLAVSGSQEADLWSSQAVFTSLFTEKVILFPGPTGLTRLAGVTGLGSLATLFGRWVGDSSAPGLPSTPLHPNSFFPSEEEGGGDCFLFSVELTASETASKDLSFGSFPPACSSHFSLSGVPSPGLSIVWY